MADQQTNIQPIQEAAGAVARVNENFDAASPAMLYGRDARTALALNWGYLGGRYRGVLISNGVLVLPPSSTNYIVALRSTGAVSTSVTTTNWDNPAYLRLYLVETGAATVIGYQDHRQAVGLEASGASALVVIPVACSDEVTPVTAGAAKVTFRMPVALTLTRVRASLTTAQAAGSILTVDINAGGVSILGTKLTIDNTERTSATAAAPVVIATAALAEDVEMTIDLDQVGDGTAKGLKVYLVGAPA